MVGANLAGSRLLNWIEYDKQLRLYSWQPWWIIIALVKRQQRQSYVVQARRSNCTCLWKSQFRYKTITCWLLLSLKDYYLDEKNRLLFTRDLPTWMALLMNFSKVILLGQNLMGNCTVFRPKNKTQRFTLSKTTNVVWRNLYRPYPCNAHWRNRTCTKSLYLEYRYRRLLKDLWAYLMWTQKSAGREPLVTLYFDEKEEIKI
jgi:hypothetical protein